MKRVLLAAVSAVFLLVALSAGAAPTFKESPVLAALVKAGKLPSVDQRLPREPMVLKPVDSLGKYGGQYRTIYKDAADSLGYLRNSVESLLYFRNRNGSDVAPNVAKSFEMSADGKVITFTLREGMRWSDGTPFTADDVMFWYNDIILNAELTPSKPRSLMTGTDFVKVEKLGTYSFRMIFSKPHGLILQYLAGANGDGAFFAPKHYLSRFHPNYVDKDKIAAMVKEAKFENWVQLFNNKAGYWTNPDVPVVTAWYLTSVPPSTRLVAARNPYYFKVDPDGAQLPYIDECVYDMVNNNDVILLKTVNGELDAQYRHVNFLANYTLFKTNEAKGNYKVLLWSGDRSSDVCFFPNVLSKDPVLKQLFNNVKFKQALSIAIDRDEINQTFYSGLGTPRQLTPSSLDATYDESVAKMYTAYDPERAKRMLDEIGLTKKDAQGFRLRSDNNEPITFIPEAATAWPLHAQESEVVKTYWEKVGIKCVVKPIDRALWNNKSVANDFHMVVFTAPNTAFLNNWWSFPHGGSHFAPPYGQWYESGGAQGEKPSGKILEAMTLWDKIIVTLDEAQQIAMMKQILKMGVEELWGIGLVGEVPEPVVRKNNVGNVPEKLASSTALFSPRNAWPEQFYFKN